MKSQLDFNKNLSRYLSARKRWRPTYKSPFKFNFSRSRVTVSDAGELKQELTIRKRFSQWYQDHFARTQADVVIEDLGETSVHTESYAEPVGKEVSEEYSEAKPSLWARFTSSFSRFSKEPVPQLSEQEIEQVFVDDMKTDFKALAANFVAMLEQMGHRNRDRLKNTQEFESIKEVFKKHNIIK